MIAASGVAVEDRLRIDELYARYAAVLDDGDFEAWPGFFTEDAVYRIVPRENADRGLPLATLAFESRAMLRDRVYAVMQTLFHEPYYQRHLITGFLPRPGRRRVPWYARTTAWSGRRPARCPRSSARDATTTVSSTTAVSYASRTRSSCSTAS